MDADSSSKFIGSLTKFLQSLCNGYVEFQRGVELCGHIYLSIDTGEKVDYVLHEKVNKNDENSVTFVSNSFHAHPPASEKDKEKSSAKDNARGVGSSKDTSDDDDIMIVDNKSTLGSTNSGTIPSRGLKRTSSPGSDQRQPQRRPGGPLGMNRSPGSSNFNRGPPSTVTSHDSGQHDISVGEMKLEQITADELLSLASQVGEGATTSGPGRGPVRVGRSSSLGDAAGQPVWIKQEPDEAGGSDTGWPRGRDGQSDSSNSGSNLYPVMMHQNPGSFSSAPVFPGFPSVSGPPSSHHGLSHTLPGTSTSYSSMPGSSGPIDPSVTSDDDDTGFPSDLMDVYQKNMALHLTANLAANIASSIPALTSPSLDSSSFTMSKLASPSAKKAMEMRRYRERLRRDPVRYRRYLDKQNEYARRRQEKIKTVNPSDSS